MTERLLRLEIQLIDDRQLMLPPADGPWDDVRRDNELQLRQHRLQQLRIQRMWTEPLHWTARLVTLCLWGRGESLDSKCSVSSRPGVRSCWRRKGIAEEAGRATAQLQAICNAIGAANGDDSGGARHYGRG